MGTLWEDARMGWAAIQAHRVRSLLTVLGIVIGVAAVITLVGATMGARAAVSQQIQALGTNLITIVPMPNTRAQFTLAEPQRLLSMVPLLTAVVPNLQAPVNSSWGTTEYATTVVGTTPGYLAVRNRTVARGRFFTNLDVARAARVAVLGQTVVSSLNMVGNPVGQTVYLNGQAFTVIGTLAPVGNIGQMDFDDMVWIPITTAQVLVRSDRIGAMLAEASSPAAAPLAASEIENIYQERFASPDAVRVVSQDQTLATVGSVTATLTWLLASVAAISLLVGGIGVMNIMLVAVSERTREIGLRKAVGARRADITAQFLVEAVVLCLGGSVLGVVAALGLMAALSATHTVTPVVDALALFGAPLFAGGLGLFFGLYPAMQAGRLDPAVALRTE